MDINQSPCQYSFNQYYFDTGWQRKALEPRQWRGTGRFEWSWAASCLSHCLPPFRPLSRYNLFRLILAFVGSGVLYGSLASGRSFQTCLWYRLPPRRFIGTHCRSGLLWKSVGFENGEMYHVFGRAPRRDARSGYCREWISCSDILFG